MYIAKNDNLNYSFVFVKNNPININFVYENYLKKYSEKINKDLVFLIMKIIPNCRIIMLIYITDITEENLLNRLS